MTKARIGVLLGAVSLLITAAPAAAATGAAATEAAGESPATRADAAPERCAINLDTQQVACDTSAEAAQQRVGATASLEIIRLYDRKHFDGAGDTASLYSGHECTPEYDPELQWADLRDTPAGNWNDRISSIRTFHRCDIRLFGQVDFGGEHSTWIDESDDLAEVGNGWNNRASSIKIS